MAKITAGPAALDVDLFLETETPVALLFPTGELAELTGITATVEGDPVDATIDGDTLTITFPALPRGSHAWQLNYDGRPRIAGLARPTRAPSGPSSATVQIVDGPLVAVTVDGVTAAALAALADTVDALEDALDDEVDDRTTAITAIIGTAPAGGDTLGELHTRLAVVEALGSLATDAELVAQVVALLGTADTAGDTLGELQALIGNRLAKSANLSDLANPTTARTNLGLGAAATRGVGAGAGNVLDETAASGLYPQLVDMPTITAKYSAGVYTLPLALGTVQATPPVTDVTVEYVDTVAGNDSNNGTTSGAPKLTLLSAIGRINALSPSNGVIYVKAPAGTPLREFILINATKKLWIVPWPGESSWHFYGSLRKTSGWTSEGGGVYSQTVAIDPVLVVVTTLTDSDGWQLKLTKNTGTPSTPAAGQFGYTGGKLYVRLPGDADPGTHTIEHSQATNALLFYGAETVTLVNGIVRYSGANGILAGGSGTGGKVHAVNCTAEYFHTGGGGFATSTLATELIAIGCTARFGGNDGYNCGANLGQPTRMILVDCDGSWNADEGASPHRSTSMYVFGGRLHHNGNGGLTWIDSAHVEMFGTIIERNHRLSLPAGEGAVYALDTTCTGRLVGVIARNNVGPGFSLNATAVAAGQITLTGCVSTGNGAADTPVVAPRPGAAPPQTFDAFTVLAADAYDTPLPVSVPASTFLGRRSTGGIVAMTPAQVYAELVALVAALDSGLAPMLRVGDYFTAPHAVRGTGAPTLSQQRFYPVTIHKTVTLDRLAVDVVSTTASAVARVAIYTNVNDAPGAIVAGSEQTIDCSAGTGLRTATVNVTLTPGTYWFAVAMQGATTTMRTISSAVGVTGATDPSGSATFNAHFKSSVSGAFGASPSLDGSTASTATPLVFARAA